MLSYNFRPGAGQRAPVASPGARNSEPIAIPGRSHSDKDIVYGSTSDQGHATAWHGGGLTAAAAAKSQSHSSASSGRSSISDQSSAGNSHTGSESDNEVSHLGSWAGRQTQYPTTTRHLQAKVPKESKARQAAQQRSDLDTVWRFRFKTKWRREQLKGLVGKEAFYDGEAGYDDGGWEDAMQLLGAAAPELGVRLDAWAGIVAGGASTPADAEGSTHLGRADAALALDEELAGTALPAPAHALPPPIVRVLQGAYPGTTIRRVTMRGAAAGPKQAFVLPPQQPAAPLLAAALKRSNSSASAGGNKMRLLAAQQLAILKATSNNRLSLSQKRDVDWVGCHLVSVELGPVADATSVPFITVQLTDPATGATHVLIRGAARTAQPQLMASFKQEVKHVTALYQLPQPRLQLLGSGLLPV